MLTGGERSGRQPGRVNAIAPSPALQAPKWRRVQIFRGPGEGASWHGDRGPSASPLGSECPILTCRPPVTSADRRPPAVAATDLAGTGGIASAWSQDRLALESRLAFFPQEHPRCPVTVSTSTAAHDHEVEHVAHHGGDNFTAAAVSPPSFPVGAIFGYMGGHSQNAALLYKNEANPKTSASNQWNYYQAKSKARTSPSSRSR